VSGAVFHDLNNDGVKDPGEPGLSGVTIALIDPGPDGLFGTSDDVVIATTTTAGDGSYAFTGVAAGEYAVQEIDPSGFGSTTPNAVAIVVPGGSEIVNFGDTEETPTPTPTATVTPGECGNGVLDLGEECDDGNLIDGDGCSGTCVSELIPANGHVCPKARRADCYQEWLTEPVPPPGPAGWPDTKLVCTDDDPTCDFGTATGDQACTFHVSLCFNVAERRFPRFPCTPLGVTKVQFGGYAKKLGPRAALAEALAELGGTVLGRCTNRQRQGNRCTVNVECDSAPGKGNGVCAARSVSFEPPLSSGDVCTAPVDITVPLRQTRKGPAKNFKTLSLVVRPPNNPVTGRWRWPDKDKLRLTCVPH
jgi:cysteine-rich repeat protein